MSQWVKRLVCGGLVLSLPALLFVELTVFGARPQRRRSTAKSRTAEQVGDLFRTNCARCHGADGRGDTPLGHTFNAPDFTDADWWRKHSNITSTASLVFIVSHGKGGMPAFRKKLTRKEIQRLVNYVRRFRSSD